MALTVRNVLRWHCLISGFRREVAEDCALLGRYVAEDCALLGRYVAEDCALLGRYAASRGNFLQMFRDNLSGPIFRVYPTGFPETSRGNYHY